MPPMRLSHDEHHTDSRHSPSSSIRSCDGANLTGLFHVAPLSWMLFKFAAIFDRRGKTIVILERHSLSKSSFNNREKTKGRFPRTRIRATNWHSDNKG
jgi:hypothetical protein